MKVSTYEAIMSAATAGQLRLHAYVGTLENDGVGIAPFHNFESKVPADLSGELDDDQGRHHRRLHPGHVLPEPVILTRSTRHREGEVGVDAGLPALVPRRPTRSPRDTRMPCHEARPA